MIDDIRDDPEWQEFEKEVREELIPKLDESAIVASIAPTGKPDVKYAVELGMSIMLDKPIVLIVKKGQKIPVRLGRVADKIIEVDFKDAANMQRLSEQLAAFSREWSTE